MFLGSHLLNEERKFMRIPTKDFEMMMDVVVRYEQSLSQPLREKEEIIFRISQNHGSIMWENLYNSVRFNLRQN